MVDAKREMEETRAEIARLDAQLLATLEKRAKASRRLGELRKGQPASMPLGDRAALHALVARASGELPTEAVREIFREIFSACLSLELPVRVAYLAPEGGAAHAAARGRFGASPNLVSSDSTDAAIEEVSAEPRRSYRGRSPSRRAPRDPSRRRSMRSQRASSRSWRR